MSPLLAVVRKSRMDVARLVRWMWMLVSGDLGRGNDSWIGAADCSVTAPSSFGMLVNISSCWVCIDIEVAPIYRRDLGVENLSCETVVLIKTPDMSSFKSPSQKYWSPRFSHYMFYSHIQTIHQSHSDLRLHHILLHRIRHPTPRPDFTSIHRDHCAVNMTARPTTQKHHQARDVLRSP